MNHTSASVPLPVLGYDILLVGDLRLTEPLAQAMMQVQNDDDDANKSDMNGKLPATVSMLQSRTLPKDAIMRRRHVHLVESMDSTLNASSMAAMVAMDHFVFLANYRESDTTWRQDIWRSVSLRGVSRMDILQGKVTLVAVPSSCASVAERENVSMKHSASKSGDQVLRHDSKDLQRFVPIFVCYMQRPESRSTVANMLWNRIECQSGPCSPLVMLQGN